MLRIAGVVAGALPFAAALAAYNAHFFGSPLRFGYEAALGPAGGLGLGVDPWGNHYGVVEAFAYASAELHALALFLLETPLPLVALVGGWLALAHRLTPGEWILAGWAIAPVVANLAYWHHGLFMGPRMLNEAAPAWCVLVALAAFRLVRTLPASGHATFGYAPRPGFAVALALGATATLGLGPLRLASYEMERPEALARASMLPAGALVFVHGAWTGRVAMRLAAAGMRLDSVETAIRQNSTCAVQAYADALEHGGAPTPVLDFERRATPRDAHDPLARVRVVESTPGSRFRVMDGDRWTDTCAREARADRFGVADIAPLLWQADLPGLPERGPMFARDLGPQRNAALIASLPGRTPYLLVAGYPDGDGDGDEGAPQVRIEPYAAGIVRLWQEKVH